MSSVPTGLYVIYILPFGDFGWVRRFSLSVSALVGR